MEHKQHDSEIGCIPGSFQLCTVLECLSDRLAQDNIGVVHGVEGDGTELLGVDLAVFAQDGLVGADVDDPTHQAAGVGVIGEELTLQCHGQLVDEGGVDEFGGGCGIL